MRLMRIINPIDINGDKFVPMYPYYEVIWTHDKFVAIGINGIVLHKMPWQNVKDK